MERRDFNRIKVHAEGSFVIENEGKFNTEFVGHIEDISEKGIKIRMDVQENENLLVAERILRKGTRVHFQAMENFPLYGNEVTKIFNGTACVVYKDTREDCVVIGCEIKEMSDSVKEYIKDRKISRYMSRTN